MLLGISGQRIPIQKMTEVVETVKAYTTDAGS